MKRLEILHRPYQKPNSKSTSGTPSLFWSILIFVKTEFEEIMSKSENKKILRLILVLSYKTLKKRLQTIWNIRHELFSVKNTVKEQFLLNSKLNVVLKIKNLRINQSGNFGTLETVLTHNSHTNPNSETLLALTKMWLFWYGKNFEQKIDRICLQHWVT